MTHLFENEQRRRSRCLNIAQFDLIRSLSDDERVDSEFLQAGGEIKRRRFDRLTLVRVNVKAARGTFDQPEIRAKRVEQIDEIVVQIDLFDQGHVFIAQFEARVNRRRRSNQQTDLGGAIVIHVRHPFGLLVRQSIPTFHGRRVEIWIIVIIIIIVRRIGIAGRLVFPQFETNAEDAVRDVEGRIIEVRDTTKTKRRIEQGRCER